MLKKLKIQVIFHEGVIPLLLLLFQKRKDVIEIYDYRPINLIECAYNVIAKLFVKTLSKVMHKIINPNQTAFIKCRQTYTRWGAYC